VLAIVSDSVEFDLTGAASDCLTNVNVRVRVGGRPGMFNATLAEALKTADIYIREGRRHLTPGQGKQAPRYS
jgi:hypothetical protein